MKFSKALRHIDMKDVKNKRLQKESARIKEEKKKEDTKKYIASAMEQVKYNWRSDIDVGEALREGMTTSSVATIAVNPTGDQVLNDTPLDNADDFAPGARGDTADFYNGTVGTSIKSSGSGSGSNGGFDIGDHLAFDGDGSTDGARWMITQPIDTTKLDQIVMSIIVGNDSNGGETPDDSGEGLLLYYKTPEMHDFIAIDYFPDFNNYRGGDIDFDSQSMAGFVDPTIIPVGGGSPTLQNYAKYIPTYARGKDTQFLIYQYNSSGSGKDNYGIKNISYRNKTPMQVVVPLDDPEASSFIRGAEEGSSPKKRKKKVDDQLKASDEYTQKQLGDQFPGTGVRVDGDDPFRSAPLRRPEEIPASPIGNDEVKKSFGDFNNQTTTVRGAPTAEPEAEPVEDPEVIATTQSRTATNDDGEPIEPKPVAAGAVQGADATNLDQDEPTEPEPEPEPTSPDQEEIEQELETEPNIKNKSEELLNQELDNKLNAFEKTLAFGVERSLDGFKSLMKVAKYAVQGILSITTLGNRLYELLSGDKRDVGEINGATNTLQGGLSVAFNSMDIAMSVMDGKITKSNPTAAQINTYKKSILPSIFKGDINNTIPISDVRHEYADGNIYVERINGKAVVRDNTSGIRQDLTDKYTTGSVGGEYAGFGQVGGGYSQFIIPKDGGEPYIHYYDYNYHNINNNIDVSFEGGILQSGGKVNANTISASLSHLIHQLRPSNTKLNIPARARTSMIGYLTNFKDVLKGLQTTSTLEGWPPGIHGAALTDITIPLSQLPKETQEMMAKHPLSWTPERIENMTTEQINEQLYPLLETEEQFQNYLDFTSDITKMSTEPVNTVPFAVAMEEMDEVLEIYENELLEKYGEDGWEEFTSGLNRETSEFFAAERAANEDLKTLESEERKELDENNRLRGSQAESDLWDKLVGPYFKTLQKITSSGGSYTENHPTYKKMVKGHAKWKKEVKEMQKEASRIQSEIMDKYKDLREPIENIAYGQLNTLREPVKDSPTGQARWKIVNRDGDESSGSDYTALDGTEYTGKNTYFDEYYNREENFMNQMNALYDPVADLQKYVDGAFVREGLGQQFEGEYGFSGENWSPKKGSGAGERSKDEPKQPEQPEWDPFANELKPDLDAKDGDALAFFGNKPPNPNEKQGRATHMNIINYYQSGGSMGKKPEGWTEQDVQNYINRFYLNKSSSAPSDPKDDPRFTIAGLGGDDAASFSFDGGSGNVDALIAKSSQDAKELRWILQSGMPLTEKQRNDIINRINGLKKSQQNTTSSVQVAHYQPKGDNLLEKYARPVPKKDLFERVKSKGFFNPKDIKPIFPENPPPELDPKTGMHPQYGKKAKRYKKLDPISANSMPPTGDPEIDAVVNKQKTINKIKKMARKA